MTPEQFARMLAGAEVMAGRAQLPFDQLPAEERERHRLAARKLLDAAAVSSAPADRAAGVAEAIRTFPFDNFGMDDVSFALEDDPEAQEWVPALAAAVLATLPATTARAVEVRDYWHQEAMSATTRIIELEGQLEELRRVADETPQPETQDEEIALLRLTVDAVEEGRRELRSENARLRAQLWTLAAMLEGCGRLLATSSRDWGQYALDAWLYAVICGWDCEQAEHDDTCTHGAMEEMRQRHGWDDEAVAKARRYRAAVRILTEPAPAVGAQQPKEA